MQQILRNTPRSICLRVTRNCNAACSFCQAPPTSRSELGVEEISSIARFFAENGVRSMKLSGGEPTVRDDLDEIIRAVANAGLKPVVITNGFAISGDAMSACTEHGGEFKFSIHRPTAENDQVLRRSSFMEIRENMSRVLQRGIRLSINTVVTSGSGNLMRDMARFAYDSGAQKISFIPLVIRGRAKRGRSTLSASDLTEIRLSMEELAAHYEGKLTVHCIDIRNHDYWIVENDGSLWIERATEEHDVKICEKEHLMLQHTDGRAKSR